MSAAAPPSSSSARAQFLLGARAFVPLAVSVGAYGIVWGVLAGQAGMNALEVFLMCALVFAGASQFVALDLWAPGAMPAASIIVAVAVVNLRLVLMTASIRPLLASLPAWQRAIGVALVSDEQWALTMAEVAKGRGAAAFYFGAASLCYLTWLLSPLVGRLVGSGIDNPADFGLDFAFTATFLALLLGLWKGKADLVPWLVGAAIAIATAQLVPGKWYIIAGGLAGSFAGALMETRKARHAA